MPTNAARSPAFRNRRTVSSASAPTTTPTSSRPAATSAAARPQSSSCHAAADIADGQLDVGVVVGAEALDTVRRLRKAGERAAWSHRDPEKKPFPYEAPFHPAEGGARRSSKRWLTFATRDVARRAHLGVTPDDYLQRIGASMAPMTEDRRSQP